MAEGRIKWYNEKKGYGFITTDKNEDLFFHQSSIKEYGYFGLQQDDPVLFDIRETPKGKQGFNIRPLKSY